MQVMALQRDRLQSAFSTLTKDTEGNYISSSNLVKLSSLMWMDICMGMKYSPIYSFIQFIQQDINNIYMITSRLEWERDLWSKEQLSNR
jgi:hypothetical protein